VTVQTIKRDLLSSVVVTLVAIPLCLGIALACGVPLFSGILSGIIGGIVVGILSESQLSVSGPAAGMIAVVIGSIAKLGSFELFLFALMVAGVIQIICGACRVGFIANFVPANVIQGLLAAIGILIILKQLPLAFGYYSQTAALDHTLKNAEETLNIQWVVSAFHHINLTALLVALVSIAMLIVWEKKLPKFSKVFPAAILVVLVAIGINTLFKLFAPNYALQTVHLVNLPVNDSWTSFLAQFKHPAFSQFKNVDVYIYGLMIAIVASLESLLNIEAVERLDEKHRYTSRNRELVAQGVGNFFSGLLGGLPITSVIVRSSVNINAGAKTKLSSIFHGIILILSITVMAKYLNMIPLAVLAAILIFTGFKLASVSLFKSAYKEGVRYFIPFVVTVIAIVFANLLLGILIGLFVSLMFILHNNSKNGFTSVYETHTYGKVLRIILPQEVTFLNKASMIEALNEIPENTKVIIDAKVTDYIDNDILGVIKEFQERQAVDKHILLNLIGFKDHYEIKNQTRFINATTYDIQQSLTPDSVLKLLMEGNKRFIHGTPIHKDYQQQIIATSKSQHPIAVIVSCIDSRVPVELVFDLNLGDVFVARVAGNVANIDIVGSVEFACKVACAKLIVVLGHKGCGAIKAACDHFQLGNITQLVEKIQPAIDMEEKQNPLMPRSSDEFVNNVVRNNVEVTKHFLYEKSDVLRELIAEGDIKMVGAVYDIHSGVVQFDSMTVEEVPAAIIKNKSSPELVSGYAKQTTGLESI
jgi:carbonic anhydrase